MYLENAQKFLNNCIRKLFEITITNICIQEKSAILIHKWSKKFLKYMLEILGF